ncbi:MAG: hypothetical protein ACYDCK_06155 [Thermoplasmatota archaeon]
MTFDAASRDESFAGGGGRSSGRSREDVAAISLLARKFHATDTTTDTTTNATTDATVDTPTDFSPSS